MGSSQSSFWSLLKIFSNFITLFFFFPRTTGKLHLSMVRTFYMLAEQVDKDLSFFHPDHKCAIVCAVLLYSVLTLVTWLFWIPESLRIFAFSYTCTMMYAVCVDLIGAYCNWHYWSTMHAFCTVNNYESFGSYLDIPKKLFLPMQVVRTGNVLLTGFFNGLLYHWPFTWLGASVLMMSCQLQCGGNLSLNRLLIPIPLGLAGCVMCTEIFSRIFFWVYTDRFVNLAHFDKLPQFSGEIRNRWILSNYRGGFAHIMGFILLFTLAILIGLIRTGFLHLF